jgi:hypothetical protein
MTPVTSTEVQRLIATAFDAQGWEYDLSVGPKFVEAIRKRGVAEPAQLARLLPGAFFERNRVDRSLVEKAIASAIGGRSVREDSPVPATIVIGGNNYQLDVGPGASIVNSNINIGEGTQVTVDGDASKENVLLAIEAIVRAGLADDWSDDAGRDLGRLLDSRSDLSYEDVQHVAVDVVKAEQPTRQRVKDFLTRIAASGLSGALTTGITAGLGEALTHLPL